MNVSFDIMKVIRETSFISSATNSESPEYRLIIRLTPELRTAIQDDLQNISDHLLSCGMIIQDNHEDFTNGYKSTHTRAASLIRAVQNKIKLDRHNFWKFTKVLEKNKRYYSSILQKLYSHMDSPPMYSQHHVCEDSLSESDETGALLHSHVPYVQYEDEPERRYSLSNIVFVFCSSCCNNFHRFMIFAFARPVKSILVLLVIDFLLLIMIGKLFLIRVTSVVIIDYLLFFLLYFAFGLSSICICFCCCAIYS